MPKKLDNAAELSMADMRQIPEDDLRITKILASVSKREGKSFLRKWEGEITSRFNWFDGSRQAYTRLFALAAMKVHKPIDWFVDNLDYSGFIALLDAIVDDTCDDWISVQLNHIKQDRSTIFRHAGLGKNVRKVGRGGYQIRRSQLGFYIKKSCRHEYGMDA
jgi:hypothetical protein